MRKANYKSRKLSAHILMNFWVLFIKEMREREDKVSRTIFKGLKTQNSPLHGTLEMWLWDLKMPLGLLFWEA